MLFFIFLILKLFVKKINKVLKMAPKDPEALYLILAAIPHRLLPLLFDRSNYLNLPPALFLIIAHTKKNIEKL